MRHIARRIVLTVLLGGSLFQDALAHEFRSGDLQIDHPWSRAIGPRAPTAAGYLVIRNGGATSDRLVAAETPMARLVEIHEMTMSDNIMRMRPVTDGIVVPAGGTVRLAPNGLHLMIVGPHTGFVQGARIPLTLVFERAGRVAVELAIEAPGARASEHDGH
jgi:periplasmic copper chaperone A